VKSHPFLKHITTLIFIFSLTSCLNDVAPVKDQVEGGTFEQTCNMDAERIKKILEEYIVADLDCIEINLSQFTDFVRRENESYINRGELERFILKFFPGQGEGMIKSLDLLFKFSSLVLKDPEDNISLPNISNLFDLLKKFNRYAVPLKKEVDAVIEGDSYWNRREKIHGYTELIISKINDLIKNSKGENLELEIIPFIELIQASMEIGDDQLNLELIKKFLFLKPLLIGGKKEFITSNEVHLFLQKLYPLFSSFSDLFFINQIDDLDATENILYFLSAINTFKSNLEDLPSNYEILSHRDFMEVADEILGDSLGFNIMDLEEVILNLKIKVISPKLRNPENYYFQDLITLIDWGKEAIERLYFNAATYSFNAALMKSPTPINDIEFVELTEYQQLSRTGVYKYWKDFQFITKTYRTFPSKEGLQYFTNEYKRSLHGFNMVALIRYGIDIIIKVYGHEKIDPTNGKVIGHQISHNEIRTLLLDLKQALVVLNVWPKYFERFVGEAATGTDLFQFMSNGDGATDLDEATSYVTNIFSGASVAENLMISLQEFCELVQDEDGQDAFLVSCYREHFFEVLWERLNYRKYYQKLYDYTVFFSKEEVMEYLINIEKAAKEERDETIPMSKIDLGRLFATFGSVETTMLRYDNDFDNILSFNEAEQGYLVFKNTLSTFADLDPSKDGLINSIYYYILQKMEEPNPVELVWFHLFGNKKKTRARRMNIGAIFALVSAATLPE